MNASLRVRDTIRRWLGETRAAATVEFAFVAPAMLIMMALIVFAGQAFEIQRKVTLTMRTLTDLVTQQSDVTSTSSTYTYSQILSAASLVIAPYDSTQLQMVISEVQTNGSTTAKVIWSKATGTGATALTVGSSVSVPRYVEANGYLIVGTVNYTYNPLNIFVQTSPITLTDTIYMSPRISTCIAGPSQSPAHTASCP